jgi:hypothetical protein
MTPPSSLLTEALWLVPGMGAWLLACLAIVRGDPRPVCRP